jgi:hypothetical protein
MIGPTSEPRRRAMSTATDAAMTADTVKAALAILTEALATLHVTECTLTSGRHGPTLSVRHDGATMQVNAAFGAYWQPSQGRHPGTYIGVLVDPEFAAQTVRSRLATPERMAP